MRNFHGLSTGRVKPLSAEVPKCRVLIRPVYEQRKSKAQLLFARRLSIVARVSVMGKRKSSSGRALAKPVASTKTRLGRYQRTIRS